MAGHLPGCGKLMLKVHVNIEELLPVIDNVVRKTMTMDLTWDWPCGVAYYGICEAFYATGHEFYLDLLKKWTEEYMDLGLPEWTVNTCAMGHAMLTLFQETGEEKYLEIIESKVDYLENRALRFGEGVLQHTVSSENDFPEQAWADTLFMAAFFLLRVGVMKQDEELISDALNQYYWHMKYLQDPVTGLWYHGYDHLQKDHMSGIYWGRANAWAAYTMSQVGKILPEPYLYPQYMDIQCSLRDQLAALKTLQTPGGLWRTVLDDEDSYEEVSASAGIAAAMVENGNPLHSKYINRALAEILDRISEDGRVLGVSGGTAVMRDRTAYNQISRDWMQGWGQGLALTFLSSLIKLQKDSGELPSVLDS